jgi:hypothetical protein
MSESSVKRGAIAVALFLVISISLLVISINFGYAFGISTPYLENNTLKVASGNNYTYMLNVQNGDAENYYVDISYSSTNNVVTLRQTTSFVPSNTYNGTFYFDINIPKDAKIGEKYTLEYDAKPRTENNSNITNLEIQRQITILVIEETSKKTVENKNIGHNFGTFILILVILTLIALITSRLWRLSQNTSERIIEKTNNKTTEEYNEKATNYTISQAINLKEVQILLEKISDEEFRLPEIKKLFKEKILEFTTNPLVKDINSVSRKELIRLIEKIRL